MRAILLAMVCWMAVYAAEQKTATSAPDIPDLAGLRAMTSRFAPTPLEVNVSGLSVGDQKALAKLIEAARIVNRLFMEQFWSGDLSLYQKLQEDNSPLGRARPHYFWINKGPWSEIDGYRAFLPGVPPRKLPGANFYPEDMTREEFEAWDKTL